MDEQDGPKAVEHSWDDIDPEEHNVYKTAEEPDDPLHHLSHSRVHAHERAHVDLTQEEYTPEEAARLLGTSLDVIMHAARSGELVAERAGHKVVCIQHADLVDWLRRQGPGV